MVHRYDDKIWDAGVRCGQMSGVCLRPTIGTRQKGSNTGAPLQESPAPGQPVAFENVYPTPGAPLQEITCPGPVAFENVYRRDSTETG